MTMKIAKQKNKKTLFVVVALLLVGAGSYLYLHYKKSNNLATSTNQTASNTKLIATSQQRATSDNSAPVATYNATSEGSTFKVPTSVPKDDIKNYSLVTENEQYKIRQEDGSNKYIITLYAIVNNPDQYSAYKDQLRQYKANALQYLKSKGVNTNTSEITYEPQEAAQL